MTAKKERERSGLQHFAIKRCLFDSTPELRLSVYLGIAVESMMVLSMTKNSK